MQQSEKMDIQDKEPEKSTKIEIKEVDGGEEEEEEVNKERMRFAKLLILAGRNSHFVLNLDHFLLIILSSVCTTYLTGISCQLQSDSQPVLRLVWKRWLFSVTLRRGHVLKHCN
jgi:hypothetical protein